MQFATLLFTLFIVSSFSSTEAWWGWGGWGLAGGGFGVPFGGFGNPYGGIQTINSFSGLLRLSPLKFMVVTANAYLYPV
jgi:hypothetical protein